MYFVVSALLNCIHIVVTHSSLKSFIAFFFFTLLFLCNHDRQQRNFPRCCERSCSVSKGHQTQEAKTGCGGPIRSFQAHSQGAFRNCFLLGVCDCIGMKRQYRSLKNDVGSMDFSPSCYPFLISYFYFLPL